MTDADALHRDAIVIDAVSPLTRYGQYLQRYRDGGVTIVAPTVAGREGAAETMRNVGLWHRLFRERDDLVHVTRAADIERAKREDKLGIVLHFQNTSPIEDSLDLVDAWKALGVGMVQLTYNVRNAVGDGCEETATVGLSRFGRQVVERLDAARIVVDGSHTGRQTVLDAIAIVKRPFVISHANALAVHTSPRNVDDEVIRKVADSGGLVGLVGFPAFVGPGPAPSLDALLAHADHIVKVAGHDHIGLGIDHYQGQHGLSTPEQAKALYDQLVASGAWSDAYPPPPWHYAQGIDLPEKLPNLTRALVKRGWKDDHIRKLLGGNWVRVFRDVWGG
ncbi:MAG: dipeptidase [Alphaproteobacteria bacterium]|nr:dipeptidase [Alphaproteobacteria bacterium]